MSLRTSVCAIGLALNFSAGHEKLVCAVTVISSASEGGSNAAGMAWILRDAGSAYSFVRGSYSTAISDGANTPSNPRALGTFTNGMTAPGTLLPAANQNAQGTAVYAGGMEVNSGVCLCTGLITDNDPLVTGTPTGIGVGVEGPNNGKQLDTGVITGEISFDLAKPNDLDFSAMVTLGHDPAVLRFKVTLSKPGTFRVTFVHASDEFPKYPLQTYNDTPLLLIGDSNGNNFRNIILFKDTVSGMQKTLSLDDLRSCGFLRGNLVAPEPATLPDPTGNAYPNAVNHADVGTTEHYDHEFGGFTRKLTRESCDVFAPGTYTIKIVVQDVSDAALDSATFFEAGSLKLYDFARADFNLDGVVNAADQAIWDANEDPGAYGKKFTDGDANGDGQVNSADLAILIANMGTTGKRNLKFDFNRDNVVNVVDEAIWEDNVGLPSCASRAEGDADGDGDVDNDDKPPPTYGTEVVGPCGGSGAQSRAAGGGMAGGEVSAPSASQSATADQAWEAVPAEIDESDAIVQAAARQAAAEKAADADGDGDFDQDDVAYWKLYMAESGGK